MRTYKRSLSGSRLSASLIAIIAATLGTSACGKATPPAAPIQDVAVTKVAQRDVPIYSEAVGTTDGFVNAQVRPRVQGHLLRQTYGDGASVKAGDLLFEIDDREYRAALDEARGNLARQQAALKKYELDVARYTALEAKGAVSKEELDNAVQAARGAKAQVDGAAAAVSAPSSPPRTSISSSRAPTGRSASRSRGSASASISTGAPCSPPCTRPSRSSSVSRVAARRPRSTRLHGAGTLSERGRGTSHVQVVSEKF